MKIKKYLEQSPLFALNLAYEALITDFNRLLREEEVNLTQGLLLTALFFENKTDIRPSDLAVALRTSRANISHNISYLESKKWVRRQVDEKDARSFQLELRPEGRKKALVLIKAFDKAQDRFEKELGVGPCQKLVSTILKLVRY